MVILNKSEKLNTWTDLGNYGVNTCVSLIKEKSKILDLICENIDQDKDKNWSRVYRKNH